MYQLMTAGGGVCQVNSQRKKFNTVYSRKSHVNNDYSSITSKDSSKAHDLFIDLSIFSTTVMS